MKQYSQYDEQRYILAAFGWDQDGHGHGPDKADCRFLDVGSYHPTEKSNTRALYEMGWSGVMIEPSPGPMHALLKEYGNDPRITLIQAAVSPTGGGLLDMAITDDAVSSGSVEVQKTWAKEGGYFGRLLVPTVTPHDIATQFGGFEFVNIDAEGISVDLFCVMAKNLGWRPKCWCVETDNRDAELAAIAKAAGYKSVNDAQFGVLGNGTNVVLVR